MLRQKLPQKIVHLLLFYITILLIRSLPIMYIYVLIGEGYRYHFKCSSLKS